MAKAKHQPQRYGIVYLINTVNFYIIIIPTHSSIYNNMNDFNMVNVEPQSQVGKSIDTIKKQNL